MTRPPPSHASALLLAERYTKEHYHIRDKRLSREHELQERGCGTAKWQVLDEALCCTLLIEMQHAGMEGIERTTFGWNLKKNGVHLKRVDNRRPMGSKEASVTTLTKSQLTDKTQNNKPYTANAKG